jgi:Tfp pilus assembly protein PilO
MKLEPKQFYYVMIATTVLSFCGIIGAFYWGNLQLGAKAATIANLQSDTDVAQEKIIAIKNTKKNADYVEEAEKLLNALLPTKKEQEKLIADVMFTASTEAGIPLQNIGALNFNSNENPSDLSGTEQFKDVAGVYSYPFTLSVEKISYETLLKLLTEIEQNGRLVQIANLEISPDKAVPGQLANVNLTLNAFLKP